jgi:hypothetical protein
MKFIWYRNKEINIYEEYVEKRYDMEEYINLEILIKNYKEIDIIIDFRKDDKYIIREKRLELIDLDKYLKNRNKIDKDIIENIRNLKQLDINHNDINIENIGYDKEKDRYYLFDFDKISNNKITNNETMLFNMVIHK